MIIPFFSQALQLVRIIRYLNLVIHCFNYPFQLYVTGIFNEYSLYFFLHVTEQVGVKTEPRDMSLKTCFCIIIVFTFFRDSYAVRFRSTYYTALLLAFLYYHWKC